ncbi:MAG TPA: Hsp20/alpha crystallin family protein [Dehalococcoidia bacterium]|nr:Hsp20/alpha crystallin family protein [Dehalococcoidia bacterium]
MDNGKGESKATAVEPPRRHAMRPREFDRFFERAFAGLGPFLPWDPTRRWRRPWMPDEWLPDLDVFEREGKLIVRADVPGMKRDDLEVNLQGDTLVIRGHREEKEEVKETDYYHSERRSGAFMRTVALPDGVRAEAIEATYKDGVLEVTVPKPAAAEPKPVQVPVK